MKKILVKKTLSVIGLIIGLAFVIVGILSVSGGLDGSSYYSMSASYEYDSGYASFGADYYTYSVNNTAEIAYAARTIANFLGLSSILFGLMVMCGFGIVLSSCTQKSGTNIIGDETNIAIENTDVTNKASAE